MRTLKVLVAGWLAGGAFIVLLSLWPKTAAVAVADGPVAASPLPAASGSAVHMLVPVSGIAPSALRDNFTQPRGNGRLHHAIDIMAPHGTPVVAAVSGTIRKLFTSKAGGLTIYQFDEAEERVYYYAHLQRYANGIAEGMVVEQGTVIGYVGVTGNSAKDAPHLHFSVEVLGPTKEWWKGTPLNPYPLLTARASALP
ncbi:MAG TPA: M23 family metallopeptidase [Thermoanaerobaculia bacterium]|jgi:murein DD-endopeptidase MepM/ murein hydrolase activator NlpD